MRKSFVEDTLILEPEIEEYFKQIPFEFLFRDPRIIVLDHSFVALRDKRPEDIIVLMDLFTANLFKRKPVKNARDYVFANRERLVKAYKYYSNTPVIPSEASFNMPLGSLIERFICEFVDRMRERNLFLVEEEASRRNKCLEMFEATYDDRYIFSLTRDMLAEKFGLTPERIRQLLKGKDDTIGVTLCRTIIEGSSTCDDFTVNPILQSKYFDLLLSNQKAFSASVFDAEYGITNDKTRKFLLDIIGYSFCDSNVYFEPLIIKGENITALNHSAGAFVKFFSDNALYVSLEDEVIPFLQEKFPNNSELVDILIDIARSSNRFEKCEDKSGNVKYGLKWEYLLTFPSRIVRILYEKQVPMRASEICIEYNNRAVGTSVEKEDDFTKFTRKGHKLIENIGKTGTIRLASPTSETKVNKKSAMSMIDSYMREQQGKCTMTEVKAFLDAKGFSYPDGTIRTYMSKISRAVRDYENLYIHEDFIDKYPELTTSSRVKNQAVEIMPIVVQYLCEHNGKARMKELTNACYSVTGNSIRDTSLRLMLDAFPDIIGSESIGARGRIITLLLPLNEARALEPSLFEKKGIEYHKEILSTAKKMLELAPNRILPINEIFDVVVHFVPKGKRSNIVYKLINTCDAFESYTLDKKRFVRLKEE